MRNGIIFDMDGVISDTQKLHAKVESGLLSRFGIQITPEQISEKYSGVKTKEFFNDLLRSQSKKYDLDLLMEEKWAEMEKLSALSVDEIPGSVAFIRQLSVLGFPLAVASASNLRYVENVLRTLGVRDLFKAVVSGDMVSRGKPDPESFLLAASQIMVEPHNCLVFEDGVSGMEAANRAGMQCIGLVKDKTRYYPTQNLITNFSEVTDSYLRNLGLL